LVFKIYSKLILYFQNSKKVKIEIIKNSKNRNKEKKDETFYEIYGNDSPHYE
jgi:hypothetical protein